MFEVNSTHCSKVLHGFGRH